MKLTKILMMAMLLSLSLLAVTSCSKSENSSADTASGSNNLTSSVEEDNVPSESQSYDIEPFSDNIEPVQPISGENFFFTEDGLNFQIVANKAAIAYLRNDQDELVQYLSDPNYDTGLSEDSDNLFDKLEYMILKLPDTTTAAIDSNGVYSVVYQYVLDGIEMIFYLDLGLEKTENGWKVNYIYLQG